MSYSPTISFIHGNDTFVPLDPIRDTLRSLLSSSPPMFIRDDYQDADVVLLHADSYATLLTFLPILIELRAKKIPTVISCDDLGDLGDLIYELDISVLPQGAAPTLVAGLLYGLLQRTEEVSQLRGKVGLVKTFNKSLQDELNIFQDELDNAAVIQREFMSNDVRCVHDISFSTLWRPVGVVSGDMFDITQLDDDHVAFFIVDAIGHGISAAMLAMMLTRTLAANRFDPISGEFTQPKDMLFKLNTALLQRSGDNARFATAAYGILNCKTKILTFAGAGHPPALLNSTDCSNKLLASDGPLLGVFVEDVDFKQNKIQLSSGDTLLIYSDGFERVFEDTQTEQTSLPKYVEIMSQFCNESSGNVLTDIDAFLTGTFPSRAEDDLTMICLQTPATQSSMRLAG